MTTLPSPIRTARALLPVATLLALLVSLASCVSYRKFEDTLAARDRLASRVDAQADSLRRLEADRASTSSAKLSVEERNRLLSDELASLRSQYQQLDRANEDLLRRYDRVLAQNEAELTASSSELTRLRGDLSAKELTLAQQERELNAVSKRLDEREADLNRRIAELESDLTRTQGAVAARENELNAKTSEVNQLRAALVEKDLRLNALRDRMRAALTGFSDSDLTVEQRGGRVYVSLSQNLLFASGSKTVGVDGKRALRQLAAALRDNQDVGITVEGHTDTDGTPALNWDLSTGRATTVAQELIAGGVSAQRITAAGRGQYQPVADNTSAAGKARNRRTEIILTPRLGELYELVVGQP